MKKYSEYFIKKTRTNREPFYCLAEDSPESLKTLLHNLHRVEFFDSLPNDWIYEQTYRAFETLEECDLDEEWTVRLYRCKDEVEAEPCTLGLLEWAKLAYAREYIGRVFEFGNPKSLYDLLEKGQLLALEALYYRVISYLIGY